MRAGARQAAVMRFYGLNVRECDTLGRTVKNITTTKASTERLRLFAEIYGQKMAANPFLTMQARYSAMSEAGLALSERELAEEYVDLGRVGELLNPR